MQIWVGKDSVAGMQLGYTETVMRRFQQKKKGNWQSFWEDPEPSFQRKCREGKTLIDIRIYNPYTQLQRKKHYGDNQIIIIHFHSWRRRPQFTGKKKQMRVGQEKRGDHQRYEVNNSIETQILVIPEHKCNISLVRVRLPCTRVSPLYTCISLIRMRLPYKQWEDDQDYGATEFKSEECMEWLDDKPKGFSVYVPFGSVASFRDKQMEEIACFSRECSSYLLWVVRASEETKVPKDFEKKQRKVW
ncbi:hypothetical protein V8G54_031546 [Vigna mungo]|uniref:Uncharacterized protein n=1 Tax=Vigna mungo TaxID=3915 RepID=A0AAQ3RH03_VIGMU